MAACKTLVHTSLASISSTLRAHGHLTPLLSSPSLRFTPLLSPKGFRLVAPSRTYASISAQAAADFTDEAPAPNSTLDPPETQDNVEHLLNHGDEVARLMKMERRGDCGGGAGGGRWFPYLDRFDCGGGAYLSSVEVLEVVDPIIMDSRKERFRNVARNRSYSVCLVVEGLVDFGNVSAVLRSADALGIQSVHVVSCGASKRWRENRHVSMGAEKWLDIELWDSTKECFDVLTSRGYRIATTHVGIDAVSVYDMDWSCPTAIVLGNEHRGISGEALELSDLHCSIPMKGMVDSFNVSVAAGILMHHAVCDRTSRLGSHGDLTSEERQILLAEFSLRHSKSSISIAHQYAKQKSAPVLSPRL